MLTYTTNELAKELHTSRNHIDMMRRLGLLTGIKKGHAYIFDEQMVMAFLNEARGKDISNEDTCQRILLERGRRK